MTTQSNDKPLLFHAPQSRSSTSLWMLEELGIPYDLHVLDLQKATQRDPAYVAVNPMGKVPALRHRGALITEGGAVCAYLADAFPQAGLAPALTDPLRGPYLRWMFFWAASLEPALIDKALSREPGEASMMPYGDFKTTVDTAARAVEQGPWLLGDRFTAADVYFGSGIRWTMLFKILPERPEFVAYVKRLTDRPAFQRAQAKDQELLANQKV